MKTIDIDLAGSLQNPAWSPNGKLLVFTRWRDGYNEGAADLYILDLATTAARKLLADGSSNVSEPGSTWNPITNAIVFSSDRDGCDEAIIIKPDGSGRRQLTSRPGMAWEPSLSPDGQAIVYEHHVTAA